jgi:hypothetical protein
MAGDIGISERVIVVGPGEEEQLDEALERVRSQVGVLHRYGPRVAVGEIPEDAVTALGEALPQASLHAESEAIPPPDQLDPLGKLGLEAFALRGSEEYERAQSERPHDGEPWDGPGLQPPDALDAPTAPPTVGAPSFLTSERLIGSVAVGIVVVSGPTPNLQFSQAEVTQIAAQVQNGLGWLGAHSVGGGVSWQYSSQLVSIPTPPDPHAPDLEAVWRNPTMVKLGYQGSEQGVMDYVTALRNQLHTRWAYCVFFIKYPAFNYAYARGPLVVMQSPYGPFGPANIDRILTHETSHTFGAADEYTTSQCNCGGNWGIFGRPNANCHNCAPGGGVPCVMNLNEWAMCPWTTWHLGFNRPAGVGINNTDSTSSSPTAAAFNGRLYAFWTANAAGRRICLSASQDGLTWPTGQYLNGSDASPNPPSAVVYNNKLGLFWRGADAGIYYSASQDGTTWPVGRRINGSDTTSNSPTAIAFNGMLYVFWTANDASHRICFSASQDGSTWPTGRYLNASDASPNPPSAVVYNNRLGLFWRGADGGIYYSVSQDGTTWPVGRRINGSDTTSNSPTAIAFNGMLYVFWTANDASHRICFSASQDGSTWPTGQYLNGGDSTSQPVAAAMFGPRPSLLWAGEGASRPILNTVFSG